MSKKPGKQRKRKENAPLHKRQDMMAAHLSKDLREKHEKRRMPVREGDEVEIMRGDAKGQTGEINEVDLDSLTVEVDDVTVEKSDGSEVPRPVKPSNLKIKELKTTDRKRVEKLER